MNGVEFGGGEDAPPSGDAFKRAVYKQPPHHFSVQVLPPQKIGHAYGYGMLITPILHDGYDRHSIISGTSGSSGSSSGSQSSTVATTIIDTSTTAPLTTEYEVWRRWEDCLYLQDLLEVQYAIMSKEKRRRLLAGKGVKKNGLYAHEDPVRRLHRAASFESLPPGPDPNMIAKDVHELLPRLTKKGTIFKPSKDTIEQRGQEFKALIEALLREGDDVPALIRELRQVRVVRDFFGFWRRDHDRLEKILGKYPDSDRLTLRSRSESMSSRVSSIFSSSGGTGIYFSPSTLSLQLSSPTATDTAPTGRSPRRPVFMQGGKGAINLAPASPTESGPSRDGATPRRRAQTLQSPSSGSTGFLVGDPRADLQEPPASAPANVTFSDSLDNGYSSDTASTASHKTPISPHSYGTASPPSSPRSLSSTQTEYPQGALEVRYSDFFLAEDAQRKSVVDDRAGSIVFNLDEGGFDEDGHMFGEREHGYLVPESIESRLGGYHRLQHLTIKEEDEQELEEEGHEFRFDFAQSDSHTSESSAGHETTGTIASPERGASAERPNSSASSSRSTLVLSERAAAAHAEALRMLTGGRSETPTSNQDLAPTDPISTRSSVLTTTSGSGSGSGSGSSSRSTTSGHAHSSDTQSSIDMRPESYQSSIASCEDIDRNLSSSPIILHSPLLEDDEFDGFRWRESGPGTSTTGYRPHNSIGSVRTFMTESSSMGVIAPPREPYTTPTHPAMSNGWRTNGTTEAGLTHSSFHTSRSPDLLPRPDTLNPEGGVDLPDAFFFAGTYPTDTTPKPTPDDSRIPDRELTRSPSGGSGRRSRPVQNRFAGQFSPPGAQQRPTSPGLPSGARNPLRSPGGPASPVRPVSPSPSTISYTPSTVTSLSEELGMNAVSVKAIYGEHIIAFRIDRNSSLADLREKLWHKLVDQQGVTLASSFSLAYKPPGPGRVQELRKLAGRARSSSASNVGMADPTSLRILFSQRDWLDAVGSCPPGTKLTLHVLNR